MVLLKRHTHTLIQTKLHSFISTPRQTVHWGVQPCYPLSWNTLWLVIGILKNNSWSTVSAIDGRRSGDRGLRSWRQRRWRLLRICWLDSNNANAFGPVLFLLTVENYEGSNDDDVYDQDDDDHRYQSSWRTADISWFSRAGTRIVRLSQGWLNMLQAFRKVSGALTAWQEWLLNDILSDGEAKSKINFFWQQSRHSSLWRWLWRWNGRSWLAMQRSSWKWLGVCNEIKKTGVINDLLGQTHNLAISDHYFLLVYFLDLKSGDGRTDGQHVRNKAHYRPLKFDTCL